MSFDATRIGRPKPAGQMVPALSRLTVKSCPDERLIGASFELRGVDVMLGRSSDNTIPVNDPDISRNHARIMRRDSADWLIDTASANGTWVNGGQVKEVRLTRGDTILLGSTVFRYEPL